jgi:L-amino acid N-acyltransferase YncA
MPVRDATAQDLPTIVEIYNSTIPTRASTAEVRPAWFGEHEPSGRPIWVMEDEGEIVGWLSSSDFYDGRPAYRATAEIGVYVDRGHRRKGVGRCLVEEAVSRAPELGLRTPTAGALAHNGQASTLFEDFFLKVWARFPRVAELDGVERDLCVMGRRLYGSGPEAQPA